jgi:hypothetical protein
LQEETLSITVQDDNLDLANPESIITDAELVRLMDRSDEAYSENAIDNDHFKLVDSSIRTDILSQMYQ